MAPEIESNGKYDGAAVDIFAAGVVLFTMFSGNPPVERTDDVFDPLYRLFTNKNKNHLFWKCHGKKKTENFFSEEFKSLIN